MKKIILALLFSFIFSCIRGQEVNLLMNHDAITSVYVGSLAKSDLTSGNQKLKIEVYGGQYETISLGTTTYSIGVRSEKEITVSRDHGSGNKFQLVVFENGDMYDFIIQSTLRYVSMNIKVTHLKADLNTLSERRLVDIKLYDPTGKLDVTSEFKQTIMTATDMYGNMGIGTLSPKAKLDVRGKIIADEVEVKINKGADFVFEPDYQLKPLSEIENFIKENRHLPDMPSEKQMQENGLNLNDMQLKLLQKVEELTLYIIEQNKKIEIQNSKIEKQQAIINELQNK